MARTLEFYYDYGSPYSYLADTQVEAIARRAGATPVRRAEVEVECLRHADVGQALRRAVQPQSVLPGEHACPDARCGGGADRRHLERYHAAIYRAMGVDGINLNDIGEVAALTQFEIRGC